MKITKNNKFFRFYQMLLKKSDRRRRPAGNLAPCSCAAAVMYKSTFPCCTHCKTRPCLTLHPPCANKPFCVCCQTIPHMYNKNRVLLIDLEKFSQKLGQCQIKSTPLFLKWVGGSGEGRNFFSREKKFRPSPDSDHFIAGMPSSAIFQGSQFTPLRTLVISDWNSLEAAGMMSRPANSNLIGRMTRISSSLHPAGSS